MPHVVSRYWPYRLQLFAGMGSVSSRTQASSTGAASDEEPPCSKEKHAPTELLNVDSDPLRQNFQSFAIA
jgi:hypothetical protein